HFDTETFLMRIFAPDWEALELKQRMRRGTEALRSVLPSAYEEALEAVLAAAERSGSGLPFLIWSDFVEVYGLDDPDRSIPALAELTKYASSEFAVRPFLIRYPERMLAVMLEWARSGDE